MANFSLISPTIWVHDQDLSGYLKKITVKAEAAELDVTNFASGGFHQRLGGLKTVAASGDGFWDSTPDASLFPALGVTNRVVTISPQGAETNVAYLWQANQFTYEQFGTVGEAAPFVISSQSSSAQGLIRGQIASTKRTISGAGNVGSILSLGAVGATQFLYATIHVFTAATTITLEIDSAPTFGFAAPTTRISFSPITTSGGTWAARVAGPITDGFWKLYCSAATGSFVLAASIGIQ